MHKRKVILYIACSLDGYIAAPNDDLSFLDMVQKEGEDYGYADFMSTIDTVILGRKTYDWVMQHVPQFSHTDKETYVITRLARESHDNLIFYSGDLTQLLETLRKREGKHIFCDGGAETVNALLKKGLIDEIIISIVPVLLGGGTRLFREGLPIENLELISARSFDTGLVQLHYKVRENNII